MKLMIIACLLALSWQSITAQTCTDVANCNSCANPGPQCIECPAGSILNAAKDDCLDCGDFCTECTADANDNVQCTECMDSYYLDDSDSCTTCGTGCMDCAMVESVLTCNECLEDGYAHNTEEAGQPCVECSSNCQRCSMADDLTSTICSKCYTFPGEDLQGYFYKSADAAADRSCKTCGSKASACTDDGTGSASITSCYEGYAVKSDNSRCLACPALCESCNGEELSGSATCTSCVENAGVFLTNGECLECTDDCDTCEDASTCSDCDSEFRVDSGSCEACPAKCEECSVDDDSGDDVCETCEESYGTKTTTSVTCDKCTLSNCDVCTLTISTGVHSCTTCSEGYDLNGDNECARCGAGCDKCTWDAGTSAFTPCETCLPTGYSDTVGTTDVTGCIACSVQANCKVCTTGGDTPECTECEDGWHVETATKTCIADLDNCATYVAASGACETCDDSYFEDSGACTACDDATCKTCTDASTCTACIDGYQFDSATCYDCGINKCLACTVTASAVVADSCSECESGYAIYDSSAAQSTTVGGQCRKCATGCDDCTWDYDANAGTCSSCLTGYVTGETGTCEKCPENCIACEYSDGNVLCTDGSCDTGYGKNSDSGECDECPENCDSCSWDADLSVVACDDCDEGYGIISQGNCAVCPGNCAECTVEDSEEAPDLLTCGTCASGYAKNEAVCSACSSNCLSCSDDEGTMTCDVCKDGYALDSSTKECVSCLSNCDTCTSSNGVVKCTECNDRYSLAVDSLSCIICTEAAFANCNSCSDIDAETEKATCETCATGYVLEDNNPAGSCIDVSSLGCDAAYRVDLPPQCSTCATGFTVTEDGECAIDCYVCGDLESMTPVAQSACQIPSANATESTGFATTEECTTGICVAFWFPGDEIVSGCALMGDDDAMPTCADTKLDEFCSETADDSSCEQCCEGTDLCNTFITTMDGQSGAGIPACTTNLLLLFGAALLAIIRNN